LYEGKPKQGSTYKFYTKISASVKTQRHDDGTKFCGYTKGGEGGAGGIHLSATETSVGSVLEQQPTTVKWSRICGFLGCCTAQCGGWIPTFRRIQLPLSSGFKTTNSIFTAMKTLCLGSVESSAHNFVELTYSEGHDT